MEIESLSDLVFGLAITIGGVPLYAQSPPSSNSELLTAIGTFALSFFILISIWRRYTTVMSILPAVTTGIFEANVFLLFLVALEPYLFNVLAGQTSMHSALGPIVSSYYALDIGGMGLIIAYFSHLLVQEEKKIAEPKTMQALKRGRYMIFVISLIFVISALPIFWTVSVNGFPIRYMIWIAITPLIWLTDIRVHRSTTYQAGKP